MLPQITYKDQTIIYAADLLPNWTYTPTLFMAYDSFPATLKEKKAFLEEAAAKNYILYLEHDAVNECCTVQQTEKGIRLKDTLKLTDL